MIRRSARRRLGAAVRWHLLMGSVAIVTVFPFYVMVVLSLQSGVPIELPGSLLPGSINFDAYRAVFASSLMPRWLLNTIIYSVVSVVLVLALASTAAFAFAKLHFRGRDSLFWLVVAMLMVPHHLTLIPLFIGVSRLGGVDTYWGLLLPTVANVQALFLMRQFIRGVPDELLDAARIDGAHELRLFWSIVLPQTKPILATLGMFVFLWHWNDFLWPLVIGQTSQMYVLTVGLATLQAEETSLAAIMAGAVVTFLPILGVFAAVQRHYVRSVMTTGLK